MGHDTRILPLVDGSQGSDTKIVPLMDGPVDGPVAPRDTSSCPVCDDGDPCTDDICEAGGLCRYVPKNCDDGDACTDDRCEGGTCRHTAKCVDNDACTDDSCEGGVCSFPAKDCADSDPCTVDGCRDGQCTHEKGGQPVYRHVQTSVSSHAYSLSATPPAGFRMESIVWRTFGADGTDRRKVYQNRRDSTTDRLLTVVQDEGIACCGYVRDGDIGYAYSKKSGSLIPVYRLVSSSSGFHLSSTSSSEGAPTYQLEALQFYVCPR